MFAKFTFANFPAESNAPFSLLGLDPVTNARPGSRCFYRLEPVLAGHVFGRGDNLDDVTVLQLVLEWHQLAVNFRSGALIPYLGMNAVGKIYRGGASRKGLYIPVWGEDVDHHRGKDPLEPFREILSGP